MRMRMFTINPVYQQSPDRANEAMEGAVHVETYTKDEGRFGGDRTIVIFAFYPDEAAKVSCKHGHIGTCCGQVCE